MGIGASAGGLEAVERLLKTISADTGMAFLIVQHLDPKHESHLSAILSRSTSMPVAEAKDRMKIVRNHVYIIPPNTSMFVRDSALRLEPRRSAAEKHLPVDSLFRSLAVSHQNMAVGVILSGTASDGAAGMRAIKEAGGITFAQDASSAKYQGMPHASIAAGVVDFVMPPEEIATSLARIGRHPYLTLKEMQASSEATPPVARQKAEPMSYLFHLLRKSFGVDFAAYKAATIGRRIRRRMALHGINDIAEYVRHVGENGDELRTLFHDMFIGVTGFFREPEAFEALKKEIFPRLYKDRPADAPIRVWVPGCSTGEEVYSLAIALLEFRQVRGNNISIQLFGTDVNEEAIKKARSGRFPATIASEVGAKRLHRYFVKTNQGYQVSQTVRDMCVFAKHDILRDPPFSKLDLVSCRNVLIYLDTAAQHKLLPLFHYTLRPSGFLILGSAETVGNFADLFDLVERRNKIYSRRSVVDRPRLDWLAQQQQVSEQTEPRPEYLTRRSDFELQKDAADLIILNEYAPAAVLVNEDLDILHFRGHTGAYLEPSPGAASLNLMNMAREGLAAELRTAIQNARKMNAPTRVTGLRVDWDGHKQSVDLSVVPVKAPNSRSRTYLVMFHARDRVVEPPAGRRKLGVDRTDERQRMSQLKHELTTTKAYLQSVIESQDAANEELRSLNEEQLSTNEELQSTTEELETSNEELQSANEELITLNEELEHRNRDLAELHNDVLNLLNSLSLSIIIVDRDLRIRRLTATALKELHLVPGDVGRSLKDVRLIVDIPDLDEVLQEVLEKPSMVRLELLDHDQHWRQVQFNSYVTADRQIEGAILSITDVHDAKLAEERFRVMVESAPDAMLISDMEGHIQLMNAQAERLFGYERDELMGQPIETLVPQQLHGVHRDHRASYRQAPTTRQMGSGLQLAALHKDGRHIPVEISLSPIPAREGTLVSATVRDVTDRKRTELETRRFAVLAERGLARDVHDNLAQGLAGIVVHLEGAEDILESNPREATRHIGQARDLARSSLEQARRSLRALRPEILEETDLAGSLERVAGAMTEGTRVEARVTVHGDRSRLPVEIEENLLRIGQEALSNAVRHAKPAQVLVELHYEPGRVRLRIVDDGQGFAALDRGRASGLGVAIMKGRAASIGGLLNIRSKPGNGTQVEAAVPTSGHSGEGVEI